MVENEKVILSPHILLPDLKLNSVQLNLDNSDFEPETDGLVWQVGRQNLFPEEQQQKTLLRLVECENFAPLDFLLAKIAISSNQGYFIRNGETGLFQMPASVRNTVYINDTPLVKPRETFSIADEDIFRFVYLYFTVHFAEIGFTLKEFELKFQTLKIPLVVPQGRMIIGRDLYGSQEDELTSFGSVGFSSKHCAIINKTIGSKRYLLLENLANSSQQPNYTILNGRKLGLGEKVSIANRDEVQMGKLIFVIQDKGDRCLLHFKKLLD